jgi:LacI family transcriptional regulator
MVSGEMAQEPNKGGRPRATLRDIAAAAGVDVSTVSRVVNGGEISVRPETRARILEEVRRRDYRPHAGARSLKVQRTGALGLLFPDFTNPVYSTIVRGAAHRADDLGYVMLMAELGRSTTTPTQSFARIVQERRVDGLIIASAGEQGELIAQLDIPHLFVNRRAAAAGVSVTVDDEAAGRLAAEALIEAGHRRLAFIGEDDSIDTARRRRAGFMEACRAAGIDEAVDARAPYSRKGGFEATQRLLADRPDVTGVFASNLLVGIGALAAAGQTGIAVPEDLSILTLDAEDAAYTQPPLTAVSLPLTEMGARAVEEMDRILKGEHPVDVTIATGPTLIRRSSLGPPPIKRRRRPRRAA